MKLNPATLRRKVLVGISLGTLVVASWIGPHIVFSIPRSWLHWFPQNYVFFLHQYLFPFFYTFVPSSRAPLGFISLRPYALILSILTWVPLLMVFAHYTSRFKLWQIGLAAVVYVHCIAIGLPLIIAALGCDFELDGP